MPETTVEIFSDGACSGNPGPGGYGAILRWNGKEKELSGGEKHTTNNRMELTGVIEALTALKYPCKVILTTDSKYVVDSVTKGWVNGWKRRGWKNPTIRLHLMSICGSGCFRCSIRTMWNSAG